MARTPKAATASKIIDRNGAAVARLVQQTDEFEAQQLALAATTEAEAAESAPCNQQEVEEMGAEERANRPQHTAVWQVKRTVDAQHRRLVVLGRITSGWTGDVGPMAATIKTAAFELENAETALANVRAALTNVPNAYVPRGPKGEQARRPKAELAVGDLVCVRESAQKHYVDILTAEDMASMTIYRLNGGKRFACKNAAGEVLWLPRGHICLT